jgi:sterol desaturase/sphingolipid hydroxylase (fatty acid hydroxylase superfamily)
VWLWLAIAIGASSLVAALWFEVDRLARAAPEDKSSFGYTLYWAVGEVVFMIGVALPLQALFPAARRRPKVLTDEYWIDLFYALQVVLLSTVSFFVLAEWLSHLIYRDHHDLVPALRRLPIWAQVLLALWLHDFIVYWRHRLEHTFWPLWSFHAVHHTSERIDLLTTNRVHPLEILVGVVLYGGIIRLGLDPGAVGLASAIFIKYNFFVHSNVGLRFGGPLKYVFVSPFMHHWHHATDAVAFGKNNSVVFAWHDWLFGTAYLPDHYPAELGLVAPAHEQMPAHSYLRHVVYPLQYVWARISSPLKKRRGQSVGNLA